MSFWGVVIDRRRQREEEIRNMLLGDENQLRRHNRHCCYNKCLYNKKMKENFCCLWSLIN